MKQKLNHVELSSLTQQIKDWGQELGLNKVGITDTDLTDAEDNLKAWLDKGYHGEMTFMAKHGTKRSRPPELEPATSRIISVRMNYLPEPLAKAEQVLHNPQQAFIARYALGRDYHKLLRKRLQKLADRIKQAVPDANYRAFVDSAPVMEKPLAQKAGLGWIGKHTNLIANEASSWFFLGEIYTDIPLICDQPAKQHCGDCELCINCCPTQAIIAPYQLDARRCISYLTIELPGTIPVHLRTAIGNRIFGCDDCMQVCPWNRFAQLTKENDFLPRASLDSATLIDLFNWNEATFLKNTEGSAIRRLGHLRWLRNIAVALGNAQTTAEIITSLGNRLNHDSSLLVEHVRWALARHLPERFTADVENGPGSSVIHQ